MAIAPEFNTSRLFPSVWIAEHILIVMLLVVLAFRARLTLAHGQWTSSEKFMLAALTLLTVGNAAVLPEVSSNLSRTAQSWQILVLNSSVVAAMFALRGAFGRRVGRSAVAGTVLVVGLGITYICVGVPIVVLTLYVCLNALLVCVYAATGRAALAGLAVAPRQQRRGLQAVVVALGLLVVLAATRIASSIAQFAGAPVDYWTSVNQILSRVFVLILIGGLTVCSAVQSRLAGRNRRNHQRLLDALEPLWRALVERFPHLRMDETEGATVHLRFYRRVIETRDGLMLLSPQLRRAGAEQGICHDPRRLAEQIRDALAQPSEPSGAAGEQAYPVAMSDGPDLDSEARALVAVSRQLGALGPAVPRPASPTVQTVVLAPTVVAVPTLAAARPGQPR